MWWVISSETQPCRQAVVSERASERAQQLILAVDCCIPGHEGVSRVRLARRSALAPSEPVGSTQVSDRLNHIFIELEMVYCGACVSGGTFPVFARDKSSLRLSSTDPNTRGDQPLWCSSDSQLCFCPILGREIFSN